MPTKATNITKLLNSKSKYEPKEVGISDIIATILEVEKLLTKRKLINELDVLSLRLSLWSA